jgi:hypothetical protein
MDKQTVLDSYKLKLYCDRRSVGQFVLVSGPQWPDFNFFLSDNFGSPLWREDGFVICSAVTHSLESRRSNNHILLSHQRLPQHEGPVPRIYIPQEQGGPDIPPVTGFPFRRPLRLAGLRWIWICIYSQELWPLDHRGGFVEVEVTLRRQSVDQFVLVSCPSWSRWPDVTFIWVTITFFTFHVGLPLWREDGSVT